MAGRILFNYVLHRYSELLCRQPCIIGCKSNVYSYGELCSSCKPLLKTSDNILFVLLLIVVMGMMLI